jgi:hypothetical protein
MGSAEKLNHIMENTATKAITVARAGTTFWHTTGSIATPVLPVQRTSPATDPPFQPAFTRGPGLSLRMLARTTSASAVPRLV